jgi:hypothetical protein
MEQTISALHFLQTQKAFNNLPRKIILVSSGNAIYRNRAPYNKQFFYAPFMSWLLASLATNQRDIFGEQAFHVFAQTELQLGPGL